VQLVLWSIIDIWRVDFRPYNTPRLSRIVIVDSIGHIWAVDMLRNVPSFSQRQGCHDQDCGAVEWQGASYRHPLRLSCS
jgi:hypothetical protein